MRFKAALICAALLLVGAGGANAGSNWIGFTGGAGLPMGDYGDAASTGWHLGATGTHAIDDKWGIGGDLTYHAWNGSDDANAAAELAFGPGSEYTWRAFQGSVHGDYTFQTQGNARPYARAGLGLYSVTMKLSSPSGDADDTESKLGFQFGGGMNFLSSNNQNMQWGLAAAYHIVPTDASNVDFLTLGVNVLWGIAR